MATTTYTLTDPDTQLIDTQDVLSGALFVTVQQDPAGTGVYDTFVSIQAAGQDAIEEGFNTDFRPVPLDESSSAQVTHSITLADVPIVTIDGVQYRQFRLDINEPNSDTAPISLDALQIYAAGTGDIQTLAALQTLTPLYDLDAVNDVTINLTDINAGSGQGDLIVYIPDSAFANLSDSDFIYLYSKFGDPNAADAGFEEWAIPETATISGIKFNDINGDGIQDNGENGLGDFTIFIDSNQNGTLDAGERSTVTAADGSYTFSSVLDGSNKDHITLWIDEVQQSGYTQTSGDHEEITLNGSGSYTIDPIGNQFVPPPPPHFAISGTKWQDADGKLSTGDDQAPVGSWTIDLFDANHVFITSTQTLQDGSYSFGNLLAGTYIVAEEQQTGWTQLTSTILQDPSEYTFTLTNDGASSADFFNFKNFSISGTKYRDVDDSGTINNVGQPGGDAPLDGVTIFIDMNDNGILDAGDKSFVTANGGAWSFSGLGPDAVGHQVLEVVQTGYVETVDPGYTTTGADAEHINFANYKFVEGSHGLTQGFWSQHKELYQKYAQDQTWMNITQNGVAGDSTHPNTNTGALIFGNDFSANGVFAHGGSGKKAAYTSDSNDNIMWALHNGATGNYSNILLGDADGNGVQDHGETLLSTKLITGNEAFTDLNTSSTGNSKTIMLNQLVAAQLNIYNGDHDPGSYSLTTTAGHDLVGEAVQWLNGTLLGEPVNSGKTSDAAWTTKFFDTGIANTNTPDPNDHIMVSGQDIKNVLEQFNMNHIVTSSDDKWVGWSTDGGVTILGIHANTPDNFWLVALEHNVITGS